MVYTAAGQPLYLPPHARKQRNILEHDFDDMQDNGMQSLLSAIELDISNGRASSDLLSNNSLHSSFVNSPDHQELMDDLLRTNFTSDDGLTDVCLMAMPADDALVESYGMTSAQEPETPKRSWSGLAERWKDRDTRLARIKSVIEDNIDKLSKIEALDPPDKGDRITKISFAWPGVAQKSYGTEKRLLTPAPYCTLAGFYSNLCAGRPSLAHLCVLPDDVSRTIPAQSQPIGDYAKACFKTLHINNDNIGKSKSVNFALRIAQPGLADSADVPLAELTTPPILLLSKPSKRTSRLKLQSSYVYEGDVISLYNRINSQTYRTKYLTHEKGRLSVQSDSWTPFKISLFGSDATSAAYGMPLLYGATVVLTDVRTGFVTEPMIVRRLDGKRISDDVSGNISQMQKVIFESSAAMETNNQVSGGRSFLNARNAQEVQKSVTPMSSVSFEPQLKTVVAPNGREVAEMDDYGQWTIVGVGSSQCLFLDTLTESPSDEIDAKAREFPSTPSSTSNNTTSLKRKLTDPAGPHPPLTLDPSPPSSTHPVSTSSSSSSLIAEAQRTPPSTGPSLPRSTFSHIQLPLTPFPTLLSPPVFLPASNRLHLEIRDYWSTPPTDHLLYHHQGEQDTEDLKTARESAESPSIYLGSCGPLLLTALQQSSHFPTDAAIEVELPDASQVSASTVPLLFVRQDGIVSPAGCQLTITPHETTTIHST